jgi:hypothetical protein
MEEGLYFTIDLSEPICYCFIRNLLRIDASDEFKFIFGKVINLLFLCTWAIEYDSGELKFL